MVESYMHRNAKSVLMGWLRGAEQDEHIHFGPFSYRSGKAYEEYPVVKYLPQFQVSQTHGDHAEWSTEGVWDERGFMTPPTFEVCCMMGMPPLAIFDIGITHKGMLAYGIEIVHRNDLSSEKIRKLKSVPRPALEVFRVRADWIMHQIGIPQRFDKFERII